MHYKPFALLALATLQASGLAIGFPFLFFSYHKHNIDSSDNDAHQQPSQPHTHQVEGLSQLVKGSKFQGDATWFEPDTGACGQPNSRTQMIAALNAPQWDPMQVDDNDNDNPVCGRKVRITRDNGKSVVVTVADKCEEGDCKYGDLDLSPAAFQKIGDLDEGRVKITWNWI